MSQLFTTRLGGLPHRPHFFVGLPSSEESTATPPVRQALNSVSSGTPPLLTHLPSIPAPRLTRMYRPDPVHRDSRNFPADLLVPPLLPLMTYPGASQSQITGNIQAGLEHASLTLGGTHRLSALASELCPPALPASLASVCLLCTGRRVPLARRYLESVSP